MLIFQRKTMPKKAQKHLFTRNGKEVTSYRDIDSVFGILETKTVADIETIDTLISEEVPGRLKQLSNFTRNFINNLENELKTLRHKRVKLIPTIWAASSAILVALIVILTASGHASTHRTKNTKYSVFSSKPLTLTSTTARLFGGNTEAAALDAIFESYNCPLAGLGRNFVKEAERNGIPFWLAAAISFQESNCGRKTPKAEGFDETYNAWGWGVWGNNLRIFDSWTEGIEKVSKYLGDEFFSQGITDPCEIMKIYTPPSEGSWCNGVKYFGDIILDYQTSSD